MKQTLYIITLFLLFSGFGFAQDYTEYYFKFEIKDKSELNTITQIISIDNVKGLEIFAYANQQELDEFQKMDYKIEFLQKQIPKSLTMATTVAEMSSWDRYPTYEVYRQMMKDFETNYPGICKLDSIGTTGNGRELYVLKISDNVETEENEPEFFYTGTMHGDETTGYVLMLRLADSILTSYGSETEITNLVDEIEIFINPNANPDGTYYGGNNTVSGAIRSNGHADLNRDFPDPRIGANTPYQPETQAMMDFAEEHNFIMAANFHGGAEVMNYPWDTWTSSGNSHVDTDWFERVCTDYVTIARTVLSSYMTYNYSDGVTNGGDWYVIEGGRQDYMNYWHQCREVTIELSTAKLLDTENLNKYWDYNKESLLQYMNECLYGIRGIVTNSKSNPLDAMIWIVDHDSNGDSSMVFTDPDIGNYHRLIEPGTYDIVASSDGYINDTAKNIVVTLKNVVLVNFELICDSILLKTEPAYINDTLFYDQIVNHNIIISNDSSAITTTYNIEVENPTENGWLEINKNSGILSGTENDTVVATLNSELLSAGYFSANVILISEDYRTDTIPVNIVVKDTISTRIEPQIINDTLWGGDNPEYEIIIENDGSVSLDYLIEIENSAENSWINLSENSGNLLLTETDTIQATINTIGIGFGNFNCNIIIRKENSTNDTIPVLIFIKDTVASEVNPTSITDTLYQDSSKEYPVVIKNIGNSILNYSAILEFSGEPETWISLNKENGSILPECNDTILVIINTNDIEPGDYVCVLTIYENDGDNFSVPIEIYVNKIQSIDIRPEITKFKLYPNPFSDQINIEFYVYSSYYVKISMFNICGNVIFEKDIHSLNNNKNNIVLNDLFNIQNLPKGIYFIQISTSNYQITKRIIKN